MIKFIQYRLDKNDGWGNVNIFRGNIEWFDGEDIVGKTSPNFFDSYDVYKWIANELKNIKE